MNTSQYKAGVLDIIARIKNYNPEIGSYISHASGEDMEFVIQLTTGTLKLPPEVAHSQEVFPALVPEEWIIELSRSYVKQRVIVPVTQPRSRWKIIFSFLG